MPDFVPIYQNRDFYIPDYDVKIRGVDLSAQVRGDVISVEYQDKIDQIDTFKITVNNWDAELQDFKYTGTTKADESGQLAERSRLFDPGQEVEIRMGYRSSASSQAGNQNAELLRLMIVGEITTLTPNFPQAGKPTLAITGQNVLRKFMTRQQTDFYENKKDSEMAEKTGRARNYRDREFRIRDITVPVVIDTEAKNSEAVQEHVLQNNQYDILFLLQRAHRNGYDVFLKYRNEQERTQPFLYFGPSQSNGQKTYIVEWGKSLIEFQPKLTTTRQVSQVTVRWWDATRRRSVETIVHRSSSGIRVVRSRRRQQELDQAFSEREEIIVDRPFRSSAEAEDYARGRLQQITQDFLTGQGSTLGTPDLRAGSTLQIQGLGPTFSGRYFVTSTTHTLNTSGYMTRFEVRKEEENDDSD